MIDFHNHLIPGVDDGAADLEQSHAALGALHDQGVRTIITTPHLPGSLLSRPGPLAKVMAEIDDAWERLQDMSQREFPEICLKRGAEIALDSPSPDVSDPRVRLAGTSFVLVEFPYMSVPPNSVNAIYELRAKGWNPIIAHPERYSGVDSELQVFEEWRRVGGLLQVNCGSLMGRYGKLVQTTAWRLLELGWVCYLSSDYHARGRCPVSDARLLLESKGAEEQAVLLLEHNGALLLKDEQPRSVDPVLKRRRSLWSRGFDFFRGGKASSWP
ncbi:tyrosine-protein phosphatase [soil metagenome]